MKTAPNREIMVRDLIAQGWTGVQAHQLAWVDFWEYGRDGRGTGGYSLNRRFHVDCRECKTGHDFGAADSVRLFIQKHKGHKTGFFAKK